MEYLQKLTDHLIKNKVGKENLEAWAEDGELIFGSHAIESGFEIKYTCNFELSDVKLDPVRLFFIVSSWLRKVNPERQGQNLPKPLFFTERLSDGRYDLGLKIEFQEQYDLVEDPNGDWEIDGMRMNLKSDFYNLFDESEFEELRLFDSHTQDNSLEN
jgi:hypothetical protein